MWADEKNDKDKDKKDQSKAEHTIDELMDKVKEGGAIFNSAAEAGEFLKELGFDMAGIDKAKELAEKKSQEAEDRAYEIVSHPEVTASELEVELIAVAAAMIMKSHCNQCSDDRKWRMAQAVNNLPVPDIRKKSAHKGIEPNDPSDIDKSNEDKDHESEDSDT